MTPELWFYGATALTVAAAIFGTYRMVLIINAERAFDKALQEAHDDQLDPTFGRQDTGRLR